MSRWASRPKWPRLGWILCVCAVLLSALPHEAAQQRAVRRAVAQVVDGLARLGGLRDASGQLSARPLIVEVVLEGGPRWLDGVLRDAVDGDAAFVRGDAARAGIRVAVMRAQTQWAVRGTLDRQGWSVRAPLPRRIRVFPLLGMLALAIGCLVFRATGSVGVALCSAGVAVHTFDRVVAWPAVFAAVPWSAAVRAGPVGRAVVATAQQLPDVAVPLAAGGVVLCAVLAAFDHQRSRGRGGALLLRAQLGLLGAVAWAECAGRLGVWDWAGTAIGVAALALMALAWVGMSPVARPARTLTPP